MTDTVIASIDVAREPAHIEGRLFRLRKLVIQPGGVVPWHSHGDRPAIIYIVSGAVGGYASNCAVPIVHPAGDATPEMSGTAHWWKNTGRVPVVPPPLQLGVMQVGWFISCSCRRFSLPRWPATWCADAARGRRCGSRWAPRYAA